MLDAFAYITRSTKSRSSFFKFMVMPSDDPPHGPHGPKALIAVGAHYRRATSTAIPGALALSSIAEPRDPLGPERPLGSERPLDRELALGRELTLDQQFPYLLRHREWEAGREQRKAQRLAQRKERRAAQQAEWARNREETQRAREEWQRGPADIDTRNTDIYVFLKGDVVACIQRNAATGASYDWRPWRAVVSYNVVFYIDNDDAENRRFEVDDYGNHRNALAAAKAYARETLQPERA